MNPFHEAAHGEHRPTMPEYRADSAVKDLDDYYSDLPVKSVNAFHQKSENLAKEERAASAAVASLRRSSSAARPTLSATAAEIVKKAEVKPAPVVARAEERQPAASDDAREPAQTQEAAAGKDDNLVSWQEVDNRRVYDKAAPVRKAAGAAYRTLRDDTSFRHTVASRSSVGSF